MFPIILVMIVRILVMIVRIIVMFLTILVMFLTILVMFSLILVMITAALVIFLPLNKIFATEILLYLVFFLPLFPVRMAYENMVRHHK